MRITFTIIIAIFCVIALASTVFADNYIFSETVDYGFTSGQSNRNYEDSVYENIYETDQRSDVNISADWDYSTNGTLGYSGGASAFPNAIDTIDTEYRTYTEENVGGEGESWDSVSSYDLINGTTGFSGSIQSFPESIDAFDASYQYLTEENIGGSGGESTNYWEKNTWKLHWSAEPITIWPCNVGDNWGCLWLNDTITQYIYTTTTNDASICGELRDSDYLHDQEGYEFDIGAIAESSEDYDINITFYVSATRSTGPPTSNLYVKMYYDANMITYDYGDIDLNPGTQATLITVASLDTEWRTYSAFFDENPLTSSEWTQDSINGMMVNFTTTDASPEVRVTAFWVKINVTYILTEPNPLYIGEMYYNFTGLSGSDYFITFYGSITNPSGEVLNIQCYNYTTATYVTRDTVTAPMFNPETITLNEHEIDSGEASVRLIDSLHETDTTYSVFFIDWFIMNYTSSEPNYILNVTLQFNETESNAYTYSFSAKVTGKCSDSETYYLQFYNSTSDEYVTRITIDETYDNNYQHVLAEGERNLSDSGKVIIRILDSVTTSDAAQSTLSLDYFIINRVEYDFNASVRFTSSSVDSYGNLTVKIKGYTNDGESWNVSIWNYTLSEWEIQQEVTTESNTLYQLGINRSHQADGNIVKVKINNTYSVDMGQSIFYLDWLVVYSDYVAPEPESELSFYTILLMILIAMVVIVIMFITHFGVW